MFDYEKPPAEEKVPTDYTGLTIGAMLVPVFFFFVYMGNPDMGLTVCIALAMIAIAIKIRWKLRRYVWFWATIALILALHVPLFYLVRWPQGNLPTLAYTLPIGVADFFLILGAVGLAEKIFLKDSSSKDEEE